MCMGTIIILVRVAIINSASFEPYMVLRLKESGYVVLNIVAMHGGSFGIHSSDI